VEQHSALAVVALPATTGTASPSPAQQGDALHLARTLISSREWILAIPPRGMAPEITRGLAGILAGEARFWSTQPMAIVRVRSEPGRQEIGAVLHYRHGTAVLYSPASRLESLGAAALSAVANKAGIFSARREGDSTGDAVSAVTIEQVSHDSPVHPAAAAIGPSTCVFLICSRLIHAELAETIGQLWTAHAELIALHG
jgi:hypothetical protein